MAVIISAAEARGQSGRGVNRCVSRHWTAVCRDARVSSGRHGEAPCSESLYVVMVNTSVPMMYAAHWRYIDCFVHLGLDWAV